MLADKLEVSLLSTGRAARVAQAHERAVHSGPLTRLRGWLGAFEAEWESAQPDRPRPVHALQCLHRRLPRRRDRLQLPGRPRRAASSHRDCVRVCEAAGAIDFDRAPRSRRARPSTWCSTCAPSRPSRCTSRRRATSMSAATSAALVQGRARAARSWSASSRSRKFFRYQQKLCAHSRNEQIGCTACIDVCSARAIRSDASLKGKTRRQGRGGRRRVDRAPAAAASSSSRTCASAAAPAARCARAARLGFAYPGHGRPGPAPAHAARAPTRAPAARDAALLIHSEGAGRRADRRARPRRAHRPAACTACRRGCCRWRVWHTASVGLDLWLAAIAQGASQVWVLLTDEEAPEYRQALAEQMAVAQALLERPGLRRRAPAR